MKYYIIVATAILLLIGCDNKKPNPSMDSSPMMTGFPASSNNSETATRELDTENEINWYGTYKGTLPAADAEGINTSITLYDDDTYKLQQTYEGKEADNAFEQHGKYNVTGDLLTLRANNEEEYYRINNGFIIKLDNEKQEITGDLSDNYRLKKE